MKLVFALIIAKERIEGGIILRKCGLPPNPEATLRELEIVDMPTDRPSSLPPGPREAA